MATTRKSSTNAGPGQPLGDGCPPPPPTSSYTEQYLHAILVELQKLNKLMEKCCKDRHLRRSE